MASSLAPKKSLDEILRQAAIRWLRTDELCEIFANYQGLQILISPGQAKPQVSDGLFFAIKKDMRKAFKEDGIQWKKRTDKNSVQEGHGKLKVEGVDKLDCSYARAVENTKFKRRIYSMTKEEPSDIVIFHYREDQEDKEYSKNCKRKKTKETIQYSRQEVEEVLPNLDSPGSSPGLSEIVDHIEQEHTSVPVVDSADNFGDITRESLRTRFEKLLAVRSVHPNRFCRNISKMNELDKKLKSLQKQTAKDENSLEKNLHLWLSRKVAEGGSGLTKLDEGGLGAIHFAAALGYDRAIEAIIVAAEMEIDLGDKNGWTALHWAAYFGRMQLLGYPLFQLPIIREKNLLIWLLPLDTKELVIILKSKKTAGWRPWQELIN